MDQLSGDARIDKRFEEHHKVILAIQLGGRAAIGTWALASSWTRLHRKSGFIPHDKAKDYDPAEVNALVESGLWDEVDGGFRMHDWAENNGDDMPDNRLGQLLDKHIPGDYPKAFRQQVFTKARALLDEGISPAILESAVKMLIGRPGIGPGLLPNLVADVIRQKGTGNLEELVREAWRTGDITELEKLGYQFIPPDPSPKASVKESREEVVRARKQWLRNLAKEIQA